MDPITLLLIGTGGAAAAGVAAAIGPIWRSVKLRRARELINRPLIGSQEGDGAPRSVFDVFRDLGQDEYAIEVMQHMDLIPEQEQDLEVVAVNLADAISSFGGYDAMVSSLRETIRELSNDKEKDPKQLLEGRLTLTAPLGTDALLPAVDRPTSQLPPSDDVKQLQEKLDGDGDGAAQPGRDVKKLPPSGLHATVDDALAELFGASRNPNAGSLSEGSGGLAAIVIGGVLGSLTTGGFWDGVSRFVQRRRVKQMRTKLNQELAGLSLDLFHAPQNISQKVEQNLESEVHEKQWLVERRRREVARHRALPRKQRSTVLMALKHHAAQEARVALAQAERDVKKLQTQIARHRRSSRHDLAGFLLYVNRAELFKDVDAFEQRFLAIEEAGELLRQALLAELPAGPESQLPPAPQGPQGPPPGPGQPL